MERYVGKTSIYVKSMTKIPEAIMLALGLGKGDVLKWFLLDGDEVKVKFIKKKKGG